MQGPGNPPPQDAVTGRFTRRLAGKGNKGRMHTPGSLPPKGRRMQELWGWLEGEGGPCQRPDGCETRVMAAQHQGVERQGRGQDSNPGHSLAARQLTLPCPAPPVAWRCPELVPGKGSRLPTPGPRVRHSPADLSALSPSNGVGGRACPAPSPKGRWLRGHEVFQT